MEKIYLEFKNVSKFFNGHYRKKTLFSFTRSLFSREEKQIFTALDDINFRIHEGEKIGLIGKNGAGKTTLLRLATGILKPNAGKVIRNKDFTPLFSYSLGAYPNLPVIDNIQTVSAILGIPQNEIQTEEILNFSELGHLRNTPVRLLSSGQRQRLFFSIFIYNKDDCWAFDESTAMADLSFRNKAAGFFKKTMSSNKTILIASHQLDFINTYCKKTIWLEKGRVIMFADSETVTKAYTKANG